jgi:thymidine phosphorylase
LGAPVTEGQPIAFVHARSEDQAMRAADEVRAAYRIGGSPIDIPPSVYRRIG